MKLRLFALLLIVMHLSRLAAQEFTGYVKHNDSLSSPIYQAVVFINNGTSNTAVKTYFNGSFNFPTLKYKRYTITITYPGYKDTVFTVNTDQNAVPNPTGITVKLKKDGMRLMGVIRSSDEKFPIEGATIILKNIMTQKQFRQTTVIDGAFNLKMEYECNYAITIDKHSKGLADKYKDTTFYLSTIGFTQPLDYKLDIYLEPLPKEETAQEPGGDSEREAFLKNYRAGLEAKGGHPVATGTSNNENPKIADTAAVRTAPKDSALLKKAAQFVLDARWRDSIARANALKDSLAQAAAIQEQKNTEDSLTRSQLNKEKTSPEQATKKSSADSAETQRRQMLDSVERAIADKVQREKKKALDDSLSKVTVETRKKFVQDSVLLANQEKEKQNKALIAQKAQQDSLSRALAANRQKTLKDSIDKAHAIAEKIKKDAAAKLAFQDSLAKVYWTAHQKLSADSIERLKVEIQERLKVAKDSSVAAAEAEKIAIQKELVAQKTFLDSMARIQEEARKKLSADSLAMSIAEKDKMSALAAGAKTREDSIAKEAFHKRKKQAEDSLILSIQSKKRKLVDDSLEGAKASQGKKLQLHAVKKVLADSIAIAKKQQQSLATDLAKQKAARDSSISTLTELRKIFAQDSMGHTGTGADAGAKRGAQYEDDILKVLASSRAKQHLDSVNRVKEKIARTAQEQIARKVYIDSISKDMLAKNVSQDSLDKILAGVRRKIIHDSIVRADDERLQLAMTLMHQREYEDSLALALSMAHMKLKQEPEQIQNQILKP